MSNSDANLNPHTYTMNGVEVSFPAKAYLSQVAMMSKVRNDQCILNTAWDTLATHYKFAFR